MAKYNEVVAFIQTNHRNPSRHRIEEHDMLNWLKATRKKLNAGELKAERLKRYVDWVNAESLNNLSSTNFKVLIDKIKGMK